MRKFFKLTFSGKVKRIFYIMRRYVRYVIGGYKIGGILGVYHWLRCHIWHRYHIINIAKYNPTGYRWGWIDRDNAMFLACFHLLVEFIEKEVGPNYGFETLDNYKLRDRELYPDEVKMLNEQITCHKEIRELYEWWRYGRKKEHSECDALYKARRSKEWRARMNELELKDEEMLMRLIKVRGALWG